jgi:hypothetical protein
MLAMPIPTHNPAGELLAVIVALDGGYPVEDIASFVEQIA